MKRLYGSSGSPLNARSAHEIVEHTAGADLVARQDALLESPVQQRGVPGRHRFGGGVRPRTASIALKSRSRPVRAR